MPKAPKPKPNIYKQQQKRAQAKQPRRLLYIPPAREHRVSNLATELKKLEPFALQNKVPELSSWKQINAYARKLRERWVATFTREALLSPKGRVTLRELPKVWAEGKKFDNRLGAEEARLGREVADDVLARGKYVDFLSATILPEIAQRERMQLLQIKRALGVRV